MKVTLINPPLIFQKGDFFSSGIPYMPLEIAYVAAYLRSRGQQVEVIDAFGERPGEIRRYDQDYLVRGLGMDGILSRVDGASNLIGILAGVSVTTNIPHRIILALIRRVRQKFRAKVFVFGNFATALSEEFMKAGADFVILGDAEESAFQLLKKNPEAIDGLVFRKRGKVVRNAKKRYARNINRLPFPAFDLLPLGNYWKLGYAHGPFSGRYLVLQTSRGCPMNCAFCFVPAVWKQHWIPRSPENVVDEIEAHMKKYGVHDFHIEDFNPTSDKKRVKAICKEILKRKLRITWKLAAGSKIETVDRQTLILMRKAGCVYISFSPESGSQRMLRLMSKPFDYRYGLEMARLMNEFGIRTQACFVLGFPGENPDDLKQTKEYIQKLTEAGIDEIALFIMTPVPGSRSFNEHKWDFKDYEALTFSPKWRPDYGKLNGVRWKLYLNFLLWKARYHPLKLLRNIFNLLTHRFETKLEMTPWRILDTYLRVKKNRYR